MRETMLGVIGILVLILAPVLVPLAIDTANVIANRRRNSAPFLMAMGGSARP
jgi:hypothetical protein